MINLKVAFVGDSGCGKSSIISRYASGTFNPNQDATVGASYFSTLIEYKEKSLKLNIWDTSGQERFDSISTLYCRNSDAIVLVCDVKSADPIDSLTKWYNKVIKENLTGTIPIFVAVNKMDLAKSDHDNIIRKIEEYGDSIRAPVFKTSASGNENIKDLFERLVNVLTTTSSKMTRKSMMLSNSRHSKMIELKEQKKCC